MHSNIQFAVGGLIEQRTKAQLVRDWQSGQAEVARWRRRAAQIIAFFGWMSAALRVNFGIGAVPQA